jgi:hypothetical protein
MGLRAQPPIRSHLQPQPHRSARPCPTWCASTPRGGSRGSGTLGTALHPPRWSASDPLQREIPVVESCGLGDPGNGSQNALPPLYVGGRLAQGHCIRTRSCKAMIVSASRNAPARAGSSALTPPRTSRPGGCPPLGGEGHNGPTAPPSKVATASHASTELASYTHAPGGTLSGADNAYTSRTESRIWRK